MARSTWSKATLQEKIECIKEKRASSPSLPSGPAPFTSATNFKIQSATGKPTSRCWTKHFSNVALNQGPSVLKTTAAANRPDHMISLGTGRPAAEFYPWTSLSMNTNNSHNQSTPIESPSASGETDLAVALNYGYSAGSPQLLRFITEHVEIIHDPPYFDWDCAITSGTTSAIDLMLQILCDPGDSVLVEQFSYPGTLDALVSQGLGRVGVKMDEKGLLPADLDSVLRGWDSSRGKKPSVLYMIPTGHNPTGITQPLERRKAIYAVAEKHNLLIIEDDPYLFLQLSAHSNAHRSGTSQARENRYLESLPVSYLSLDASSRVIRLDSMSKVLAPGLRCGWITACSQIIAQFLARTEVSMVSANGVSQAMLYTLLDETWGHRGFVQWLMNLSSRYTRRLMILAQACDKYLPLDQCSWALPDEGMFLWISFDPDLESALVKDRTASIDVEDEIFNEARANGVLVSKGSWFGTLPAHVFEVIQFRLTFAAAHEGALDQAVSRFADAIRTVMAVPKRQCQG